MDRKELVHILDQRLRLIRGEFDYTQDRMAEVLGLSKKTLVQIEKGRASLGWMGAVALCGLFNHSGIIQDALGGAPQDLILTLAFETYENDYPRTLGGKIWWKDVEGRDGFRIQRNLISQHYRLLDPHDRRLSSAFDLLYLKKRLKEQLGVRRQLKKGPLSS